MDIDNLNLCVLCTLACLTCGAVLAKRAIVYGQNSVAAELRGQSRVMLDCTQEAQHSERLATILLFMSWLPVTNCAWIADAKCDRMVQQFAEIKGEAASHNLAGNAHGISESHSRVDYISHLPSGARVTWTSDNHGRGSHAITAHGSTSPLRVRGSTGGDVGSTTGLDIGPVPNGSGGFHGLHGIDIESGGGQRF
jgi:hypothetical protein